MKKLSAIFIPFIIFSCGGSDENQTTETADNENIEASDTLLSDTLVEEVTNELTFEYFEDYAQLKTKTEIYDEFGADNLEDEVAWYAEGTVKLECTYLKNPENDHFVKFVFDEENPEKLNFIETHYMMYDEDFNSTGKQTIKTKCGTFTGMTLNELREWNGDEFEFSGFGWDYGGGIMPETGSEIEKCKVMMTLDYDYNDEDQDLYSSLLGDMIFKSDNENAAKAPIFIGAMTYYLPSED